MINYNSNTSSSVTLKFVTSSYSLMWHIPKLSFILYFYKLEVTGLNPRKYEEKKKLKQIDLTNQSLIQLCILS